MHTDEEIIAIAGGRIGNLGARRLDGRDNVTIPVELSSHGKIFTYHFNFIKEKNDHGGFIWVPIQVIRQ